MKIRNVTQLNDFLSAVDSCEGQVWLETSEGDKFNLKSSFNKYIALGALLSEDGEELELYCSDKDDEQNFLKYFKDHPESL